MVELLGGGGAELEELRPLACDSEVCVGITASFLLSFCFLEVMR